MKILPVFIPHEGCPNRCLFCNQAHSGGRQSPFSAADLESFLADALEHRRVDEIAFYGGSFTAMPVARQVECLEITRPFLDRGRAGSVRISTRPDALAHDSIERLIHFRVGTVELGCQSFSDTVLDASGRGYPAAAIPAAVQLLKTARLRIGLQLMPGLPGGSRNEALASLRDAIRLRPDFLRIYPAVVLAGTGMADLWQAGRYQPLSQEEAVDLCAEMALECRAEQVNVVRIGLQADIALDGPAVLDGPYHPAFGQLVASRIWRRALERLLRDTPSARVAVHPRELSAAIGNRRCNLLYLQQQIPRLEIVAGDGLERNIVSCRDQHYDLHELARQTGEAA